MYTVITRYRWLDEIIDYDPETRTGTPIWHELSRKTYRWKWLAKVLCSHDWTGKVDGRWCSVQHDLYAL
jgi:hypothetical protein